MKPETLAAIFTCAYFMLAAIILVIWYANKRGR
jgi:hypothetical protein